MILKEEPLVVGPTKKAITDPFWRFFSSSAICVGCCSQLDNKEVSCPNCQFPMCGKQRCWEEGSPHARGECSEMAKSVTNNWPDKMYKMILAMRCIILRDREPETWKKLLQLKSMNCGQISTWTSELESSVKSSIAELMVNDPTASRDWMVSLIRVFFINCYELPVLEDTRCEGLRVSYNFGA